MNYEWDWGAVSPYFPVLVRGCGITLALTVVIILLGTPFGIVIGLILRKAPVIVRGGVRMLIEALKALPPLVILLFSYYFIPSILPGWSPSPIMIVCISLSAYLAAFTSDVIRGALDSIPVTAIDAARAVGLSEWMILRRIHFPWVIRSVMPTMLVLWVGTVKNTSLASFIGVYEITHASNLVIANTFRSIETYAVAALLYIALVLPVSLCARMMESAISARFHRAEDLVV